MEAETNEQRRRLILAGLIAAPLVTTSALAADRKPSGSSSRAIKFDAKPAPFAMDTSTTAVMVVDMQNDFGSKGCLTSPEWTSRESKRRSHQLHRSWRQHEQQALRLST